MALATVWFLTAIFTLVHLRPLTTPEEEHQFRQWMSQHKRVYNTEEEFYQRLQIFMETKRMIDRHNAENHSYTMGLNQFADMTSEEFRKIYLMSRPQSEAEAETKRDV